MRIKIGVLDAIEAARVNLVKCGRLAKMKLPFWSVPRRLDENMVQYKSDYRYLIG